MQSRSRSLSKSRINQITNSRRWKMESRTKRQNEERDSIVDPSALGNQSGMIGKVSGPVMVTLSGVRRRVKWHASAHLCRISIPRNSINAEPGRRSRWVPVHCWEEHKVPVGQRPTAELVEGNGEVLRGPPSKEG